MRKKGFKLFACAVAMTMALSLGACGSKDDEDTKAKTEESSDEEEEADDSSEEITGKFDSIEDYVNSELLQSQLSSMMDSLEGSGMSMEVKGEGDKLIYSYKYDEVVKAEGMAETLQAGLESQASTFSQVASSLKLAVDVENPIVVVEYIDANGEMIYSQEFTAE